MAKFIAGLSLGLLLVGFMSEPIPRISYIPKLYAIYRITRYFSCAGMERPPMTTKPRTARCKDHGGRAIDHTWCPDCEAEMNEELAASEPNQPIRDLKKEPK